MAHKIIIETHPAPAERQLLAKKAAEYGMSEDDFMTWLLDQALNKTSQQVSQIIKH